MLDLTKRQNQIIEFIQIFHFMTVKQLSQKLEVSEMTIRRDIAELAEKKLINQVYGGITEMETSEAEKRYSIAQEQRYNTALKQKLAAKAMELIDQAEVLFFDSGTTVQTLAELLPSDSKHTIITASMNTMEVVTKLPNCNIISPGGNYSPGPKMFYSYNSPNFIEQYRATKCFIGTTGCDESLGMTCSYMEDVPLKQAMMKSSKEKILLVDSSKFGKTSIYFFANSDEFTTIVTDDGIPEEYEKKIREKNINLIIA